jgi:hypothetical protein
MYRASIPFGWFGEASRWSIRGRMPPMGTENGSLRQVAMVWIPLFFLASIVMLRLLPSEVLTILMAWILASFPIGVLIGHCVLSEE